MTDIFGLAKNAGYQGTNHIQVIYRKPEQGNRKIT
jgi:hypothetical protein